MSLRTRLDAGRRRGRVACALRGSPSWATCRRGALEAGRPDRRRADPVRSRVSPPKRHGANVSSKLASGRSSTGKLAAGGPTVPRTPKAFRSCSQTGLLRSMFGKTARRGGFFQVMPAPSARRRMERDAVARALDSPATGCGRGRSPAVLPGRPPRRQRDALYTMRLAVVARRAGADRRSQPTEAERDARARPAGCRSALDARRGARRRACSAWLAANAVLRPVRALAGSSARGERDARDLKRRIPVSGGDESWQVSPRPTSSTSMLAAPRTSRSGLSSS